MLHTFSVPLPPYLEVLNVEMSADMWPNLSSEVDFFGVTAVFG